MPGSSDPEQGWKLHVAATVLTANTVLERLGPFLNASKILFKAPRTLQELSRLNSGLFYGYTQVGKCFTVYPASDQECVALAERLHELTCDLATPSVPFDGRYREDSSVFYRYGSFKRRTTTNEDGSHTLAIVDPEGKLVSDSRKSTAPSWANDPFQRSINDELQTDASPLGKTLRVFRAMSQRGKGGIYHAADFSGPVPRFCVLKEGRKNGEVTFDGRDGYWRVKQEKKVLRRLQRHAVRVPEVYSSFEADNNFYLVIEYIEGVSLERLLARRKRRLPLQRCLQLGIQVAQIVSKLHSAGWVWRDCKPANLIITNAGELRPIDFEGACKVGARNPLVWGTQSFLPADFTAIEQQSQPATDLYALGVVIYYVLMGNFPAHERPLSIGKLRRGVPSAVLRIVSELMSPNASRRPSAWSVAQRLTAVIASRERLDERYVLAGT